MIHTLLGGWAKGHVQLFEWPLTSGWKSQGKANTWGLVRKLQMESALQPRFTIGKWRMWGPKIIIVLFRCAPREETACASSWNPPLNVVPKLGKSLEKFSTALHLFFRGSVDIGVGLSTWRDLFEPWQIDCQIFSFSTAVVTPGGNICGAEANNWNGAAVWVAVYLI